MVTESQRLLNVNRREPRARLQRRRCEVCEWRAATAGRLCEQHALEQSRLVFLELGMMLADEHQAAILGGA